MNKVILIVGALSGVGRATAMRLAKHGANVVVADRDSKAGNDLADSLCATGVQAEFFQVDVRRKDEVTDLISKVLIRFGRLDASVNAGDDVHDPRSVYNTDLLGRVLCMRYELRASLSRADEIANVVDFLCSETPAVLMG